MNANRGAGAPLLGFSASTSIDTGISISIGISNRISITNRIVLVICKIIASMCLNDRMTIWKH